MALVDHLRNACCALSYCGSRLRGVGGNPAPDATASSSSRLDDRELGGYPNNHNYKIRRGRLIPSFQLFRRWSAISALYPEPLESLLDVGSCKGFFVLEAAARPSCTRAVGIDVPEEFVTLSEKVRVHLAQGNASFQLAQVADVQADLAAYGGPFQALLLINTYHYLFWASDRAPAGACQHRFVLSRLSDLCSDRLIFSNPLEIEDCPRRLIAQITPDDERRPSYTKAGFLDAAGEHFVVEEKARLGKRPLYSLRKR